MPLVLRRRHHPGGGGQVVGHHVLDVVGALAGRAAVVNDHHFGGDSIAAVGPRKRVVVDRDVGGEGVVGGRVGVDRHRVGGANRLQIHSGLAGEMELAEEVGKVIGARIGGELVGDEGFVREIGKAARRADAGDALQRVMASAIGRAGLATLAGEEEGSRPEQVSGRRCTWPHGGRQMSGGRCDICQRMAYHCGSQ